MHLAFSVRLHACTQTRPRTQIYCFPMARMVSWTRPSVTLHALHLPCFSYGTQQIRIQLITTIFIIKIHITLFFLCLNSPMRARASSFLRFLRVYHIQWHTTVDRIPLDEGSARRRDVYLTIHDTHKRQTSMPPTAGFEPTIAASDRPQTLAWDRSATGIGYYST